MVPAGGRSAPPGRTAAAAAAEACSPVRGAARPARPHPPAARATRVGPARGTWRTRRAQATAAQQRPRAAPVLPRGKGYVAWGERPVNSALASPFMGDITVLVP